MPYFAGTMLLLFSHTSSPRLQYICQFVFKEMLGADFSITIDSEAYRNYAGPRINYSQLELPGDEGFQLRNHSLLFEDNIVPQKIDCFTFNDSKAFFKTADGDLPFDILAAAFYLLSRYEEYLPHEKDEYGRYAHTNSLAYREGFLEQPLLDSWIRDFAVRLQQRFPSFNYQLPAFSFQPTYDIDIAYSYLHKGLVRNLGGFLKAPSLERIAVLLGIRKDPFDSYAAMEELHKLYRLSPVWFFLVPERNGKYDKNILPHKKAIWQLISRIAKKYKIGLHPSWQSGDQPSLLKKEKAQLEAMSGNTVSGSRQHYIRFNLPEDYRRLIAAGISDDYSMGYGSINGFRASVAASFNWYDLEKDESTALRIHPFCFMDANAFYEQRQNPEQTLNEMMNYYRVCKENGGTMITIWHNNFLGTDKAFAGWAEIYAGFIAQVQQ